MDSTRTSYTPSIWRNRSFMAMTATQFLGGFNDNIYKQLILLLAAVTVSHGTDYQGVASGIFALPFVLLSGYAGYLSDRYSKRTIIVLSKITEIIAMGLGMLAFWYGSFGAALAVLGLMGAQSAFFGPAKYGILPETLSRSDLPRANGLYQMTTFLSIILGTACAGFFKQEFHSHLWVVAGICVAIAVVGTITSLGVNPTPAAQPDLKFEWDTVGINKNTRELLGKDRNLRTILFMTCLFWFIAGMVFQAINSFGLEQLSLNDFSTSLLVASVAIGIAIGSLLAAVLSRGSVNFGLVRGGAATMAFSMACLTIPVVTSSPDFGPYIAGLFLILAGMGTGMFAVPLQVYMQSQPPAEQKGRVIGAMNLLNWIGILLAAVMYQITINLLYYFGLPPSLIFGVAGSPMLLVGLFFHAPPVKAPTQESIARAA